MHEKHRWVAFENLGEKISKGELVFALRKKALELFGLFGYSCIDFRLIEFDEENQTGIVLVPLNGLPLLRVIFLFLRVINNKKVFLNDVLVSGTIKTLKERLKNNLLWVKKTGPAGFEPATCGSGDRRSIR